MRPHTTRTLVLLLVFALAAPFHPAFAEDDEWKVYWKNGTRIESQDGEFAIKIGGRIQADFTFIGSQDDAFDDEDGNELFQDGNEFRRARLYVEGTCRESP